MSKRRKAGAMSRVKKTTKAPAPKPKRSERPTGKRGATVVSVERTSSVTMAAGFGGLRGAIDARELFWNNVMRDILMSLSVMRLEYAEAIERAQQLEAAGQALGTSGADTSAAPAPQAPGGPGPSALHGTRDGARNESGDESGEEDEGSEDREDGEDGGGSAEERLAAKAESEGIELSGVPPFDGRMAVITQLGVRIAIADVYPLFACSIGDTAMERALSEDVQCSVFQIRTPQGEVFTLPLHEIRSFHSLSEELMREIAESASREDASGVKTTVPFGFGAYTSLAKSAETKAETEAK